MFFALWALSTILCRQNKKNEAVPVTLKVQGNEGSQAQEGSMGITEVCSSIKRSLEEDPATPPTKIGTLEMGTSSNKTWELPTGLAHYINMYTSHHVTDKEIKEKMSPVPSNMKGTPVFG